MSEKWTPGPWRYEGREIVADAPPPEYERTVVGMETQGSAYMQYETLVLSDADATLIASAPSLYAALARCAEEMEWAAANELDPVPDAYNEALREARAVLRRARGEG